MFPLKCVSWLGSLTEHPTFPCVRYWAWALQWEAREGQDQFCFGRFGVWTWESRVAFSVEEKRVC